MGIRPLGFSWTFPAGLRASVANRLGPEMDTAQFAANVFGTLQNPQRSDGTSIVAENFARRYANLFRNVSLHESPEADVPGADTVTC